MVQILSVGLPGLLRAALGTLLATGGVGLILARVARIDAPLGQRDSLTLARAMLAGVALALFGVGFLSVEYALSPWLAGRIDAYSANLDALLQPDVTALIPAVFVVAALLPGICEEFLFRGVVRGAMDGWSRPARVLAIGLLFALVHVEPAVLMPLFYIGCLFTVLAERAGGWAAAALAHISLNAFNAIISTRLFGDEPLSLWVGALLVVAGASVGTLAVSSIRERPGAG